MTSSARMIVLGIVLFAVAGCASGVGPPTVAPAVDVTGKWVGQWVAVSQALGSGTIEMTLKQNGSQYTGEMLVTGTQMNLSGYTQGVVSGNEVRILRPPNLTGTLTVQGDTMSGQVQGVVPANVTLKRQK